MNSRDTAFWEKQSEQYTTAFEKNDIFAAYLERTEERRLLGLLHIDQEMKVLDLGCGTGRWAFFFAKGCKKVVAVDLAAGMIERVRKEALRQKINNIEFYVSALQDFKTTEKFDLVIVSGVLVYFNDQELSKLIEGFTHFLKPSGRLISRETVGIHKRIEIQKQKHAKVGDEYSAIYRLPQEYEQAFTARGFSIYDKGDFAPVNFPMIFYRRLIPDLFKNRKFVRLLLKFFLEIQFWIDPFLLKFPVFHRVLMNRFWKIKSMFFVYGIH